MFLYIKEDRRKKLIYMRPFQILCKPSRSCRIEHDFGGFIHEKETEPNPGRDGTAREDIRDAAIFGCQ